MNTRIIMKTISSILLTAVLVFAGLPLMPGVVKGDTVNDVQYQEASMPADAAAIPRNGRSRS